MSIEQIGIDLDLDIDAAKYEAEDMMRLLDDLAGKSKRTVDIVKQDMRTIDRTVNISISMVHNVLQMVGATLDPMAGAILQTIQVTVNSLYRIAAAWGTTGYGLPMSIAIGAAAIGLAVWSASEVSQGMTSAKNQIQGAIGLTQNMSSLLRGLGRD